MFTHFTEWMKYVNKYFKAIQVSHYFSFSLMTRFVGSFELSRLLQWWHYWVQTPKGFYDWITLATWSSSLWNCWLWGSRKRNHTNGMMSFWFVWCLCIFLSFCLMIYPSPFKRVAFHVGVAANWETDLHSVHT